MNFSLPEMRLWGCLPAEISFRLRAGRSVGAAAGNPGFTRNRRSGGCLAGEEKKAAAGITPPTAAGTFLWRRKQLQINLKHRSYYPRKINDSSSYFHGPIDLVAETTTRWKVRLHKKGAFGDLYPPAREV